MASMLKSKQMLAVDKLHHYGCSCCNSKQKRRTPRKNAKRKETRFWKKDQQNS